MEENTETDKVVPHTPHPLPPLTGPAWLTPPALLQALHSTKYVNMLTANHINPELNFHLKRLPASPARHLEFPEPQKDELQRTFEAQNSLTTTLLQQWLQKQHSGLNRCSLKLTSSEPC